MGRGLTWNLHVSVKGWVFIVSMTSAVACSASYKPIVNPSTGKPDYITFIDSNTIQPGNNVTITPLSTGAVIISATGSAGGPATLPLPGGATNYIWNSPSLQAGSTAYPEFLYTNLGALGGVGGVYGYSVGSGAGTLGYNSYGGGYAAGVNGFGGLWQFTANDGKLIYFNESNVSAGSPHGHSIALTIDASGNAIFGNAITVTASTTTLNTIKYFWPGSQAFGVQALTNDGTGVLSWQSFKSGTYTPFFTSVANLDSIAGTDAQYLRVGNSVTVSGRFTANPTLTATSTTFGISLPVSSSFGNVFELGGVAFCGNIAAQGAEINADVANDRANVTWIASDPNSQTWSYTYTYQVL